MQKITLVVLAVLCTVVVTVQVHAKIHSIGFLNIKPGGHCRGENFKFTHEQLEQGTPIVTKCEEEILGSIIVKGNDADYNEEIENCILKKQGFIKDDQLDFVKLNEYLLNMDIPPSIQEELYNAVETCNKAYQPTNDGLKESKMCLRKALSVACESGDQKLTGPRGIKNLLQ